LSKDDVAKSLPTERGCVFLATSSVPKYLHPLTSSHHGLTIRLIQKICENVKIIIVGGLPEKFG
jgi:hypothetical protein